MRSRTSSRRSWCSASATRLSSQNTLDPTSRCLPAPLPAPLPAAYAPLPAAPAPLSALLLLFLLPSLLLPLLALLLPPLFLPVENSAILWRTPLFGTDNLTNELQIPPKLMELRHNTVKVTPEVATIPANRSKNTQSGRKESCIQTTFGPFVNVWLRSTNTIPQIRGHSMNPRLKKGT